MLPALLEGQEDIKALAELAQGHLRKKRADLERALAGMAPGNNESGGKQRSGKTRQGHNYLLRGLVLVAHYAARKKHHSLRSLYYRLAARRVGAR